MYGIGECLLQGNGAFQKVYIRLFEILFVVGDVRKESRFVVGDVRESGDKNPSSIEIERSLGNCLRPVRTPLHLQNGAVLAF